MSSGLLSGWRFKALLLSIVAAAAGYLAMSLLSGWPALVRAASAVGLQGIVVLLGMSMINYLLRSVRWTMYLHRLGHPIGWARQLRIYFAGFALTTTPGKAGEAVRSIFLARLGVPYAASLAAMFSERFSDLLAVLLLCIPGLDRYPRLHPMVVLIGVVAGLMLLLLSNGRWMDFCADLLGSRTGRMANFARQVLGLLQQACSCHAGWVVVPALLLGLVAWGSEAMGFAWLLHWLGVNVSLRYAVFVYAASMLVGAVSVMPGGLGGAEAAMVALLVFGGAPADSAVAATILIRLSTLWFAVALGMSALTGLQGGGEASPAAESRN